MDNFDFFFDFLLVAKQMTMKQIIYYFTLSIIDMDGKTKTKKKNLPLKKICINPIGKQKQKNRKKIDHSSKHIQGKDFDKTKQS